MPANAPLPEAEAETFARLIAQGVAPQLAYTESRIGLAKACTVAEAQKVCALCPTDVHRQCLAYALAWPGELSGVWGGVDERQLNAMKREMHRV